MLVNESETLPRQKCLKLKFVETPRVLKWGIAKKQLGAGQKALPP